MDFPALLKKSWYLVFKNKFLWYLGFLAGGIGAIWADSGYRYSGDDQTWQKLQQWRNEYIPPSVSTHLVKASSADFGKVLGESTSAIARNYESYLVAGAVVALLLFALMVYVNVTAKAGLIRSIYYLAQNKEMGLRKAWREGHHYFWRRLSFGIVFFLLSVVPLMVLIIPVVLLGIYEHVVAAVSIGIIFSLALLLYWLYLSLVVNYAERILLLEDKRPIESMRGGARLFNQHWRDLLVLYIILFAVGIVAGLIIASAILLIGKLLFALGFIIYLIAGANLTLLYALLAFLLLFATLIVLSGFFGAYISANFTLGYLEVRQAK